MDKYRIKNLNENLRSTYMKLQLRVLKLNKNIRFAIIAGAVFFILLFAITLFNVFTHREYKEAKITHFKYSHDGNINYKVKLKPNMLYGPSNLEEERIYISNFIDYIKAQFSYNFNGERKANIIGDYEVVALIEGYTGEKETYNVIWKKKLQLFPKTKFQVQDNKFTFMKELPIRYQDYNNYVNNVNYITGLNTEAKATISMNVNLRIETDKGTVEEKDSPAIIVPLKTNYFSIEKKQAGNKPGAIEETIRSQVPVDFIFVAMYCFIVVLLIVVLLYVVFYTVGIVENNPILKNLNNIFKEHGNRLVALKNDLILESKNTLNVRSMDDLVRVADEINKPIMYIYSKDFNDIKHFFVFDENCIFVFNLNDMIFEQSSVHRSDDKTTSF